MKMIIDGSCDIGFWCLNMRIEGKEVGYNMQLKNQVFETQVVRHEEKSNIEEVIDKSSSMNENVHRWLV